MKRLYGTLPVKYEEKDIAGWIRDTTRERQIDLQDYNNQVSGNPIVFSTIPASSTDTSGSEQVGDISVNTTHLHVVVDNAGTLEWRRVAIGSF